MRLLKSSSVERRPATVVASNKTKRWLLTRVAYGPSALGIRGVPDIGTLVVFFEREYGSMGRSVVQNVLERCSTAVTKTREAAGLIVYIDSWVHVTIDSSDRRCWSCGVRWDEVSLTISPVIGF